MHTAKTILAILAAATLAAPLAAAAYDREAPAALQVMVAQNDGPSLSEAVERVRRKYDNARILSASTERRGRREVHVIKVLTDDGKVKTERIPGRSLESRG